MMKVCTVCKIEKELDEFYKHKGGKFGVRSKCKVCKKEYDKQWCQENKEKIAEYKKQRRSTDPLFKLKCNLRSLIGMSLKGQGYVKYSKTSELLGCSFQEAMEHLSKTYQDRYGEPYCGQTVHIDHIIPCSSATTEDELIELQHISNLQFLKPEDNLAKGDSLCWD